MGAHRAAGLRFLAGTPRSRWLSAAGGISVAYVIVHLLPELAEAQRAVRERADGAVPFVEEHVYLIALVGLALFYGIELSSRRSRRRRSESANGDERGRTTPAVFWLSIGSFAVYNAIIGYLLVHREDSSLTSLTLFALALGVHFVVNDHGLREHHKDAYREIGRWVLAAAILVGWLVGAVTEISDAAIGMLLAFIGGGVILNVMKEELPEGRESRFSAFAVGAAAYAALLVAI